MLDMAEDYVEHIVDYSKNNSFLARIYGVFTVSTEFFQPLDIILMQNTAMVC